MRGSPARGVFTGRHLGGGLRLNAGLIVNFIYNIKMTYELIVLNDDATSNAVASLLHITLTHVAEFQVKMLKAVSEHFGLPLDSVIGAVRESPDFQKKHLDEEVLHAEVVKPVKTKKGRKVIVK